MVALRYKHLQNLTLTENSPGGNKSANGNNSYGLFLLYVQVKDYQNILILRCRLIVFTPYQAFSKNKEGSGTSLFASFSARFLKKNISHAVFY